MDFVTPKHRVFRSPDGVQPEQEFAANVPFRPRDEAELKTLREAGVLHETPEVEPEPDPGELVEALAGRSELPADDEQHVG